MSRPFVVVTRRSPLTEERVAEIATVARDTGSAREASAWCGVSLATVYRVLAADLPRRPDPPEPPRVVHDPAESRRQHLTALLAPERPEPLGVARVVWGLRLACGQDCLRLDGRPVTFYGLMRRTNAALREEGLPVLRAFEQ